jgi:hypothetical protein
VESMKLIPAPRCILVQPSTVDDNEEQRPCGLIAIMDPVQHDPRRNPYRGIILAIGERCWDLVRDEDEHPPAIGDIVHYIDYTAIRDQHIVSETHVAGWEK